MAKESEIIKKLKASLAKAPDKSEVKQYAALKKGLKKLKLPKQKEISALDS